MTKGLEKWESASSRMATFMLEVGAMTSWKAIKIMELSRIQSSLSKMVCSDTSGSSRKARCMEKGRYTKR